MVRGENAHEAPLDAPAPRRQERLLLAGLTLLACALRVAAAAQVRVVAPDGVRFIATARRFAEGDFSGALSGDYHPLYPLLVALARPFSFSWEMAALLVSIVLSTLTLPFLFWLFRPAFGRPAALLACAVFAVIPPLVRPGADTLSEGAFLFFCAASLALGSAAFRGRWNWAIPAGLAAGFAYLTRPEGLGVLLALGLFTVLVLAAGFENRRRLAVAAVGLLVLFGFLVPASPYVVHLRVRTGRWELSAKKSVSNFGKTLDEKLEEGEEEKPPDVQRHGFLSAWTRLVSRILRDLYYVPALFALAGLLIPSRLGPKRRWRLETLPLFAAAIAAALGFVLLRSHGYLSHRHVLPVAVFLLGHVGRGADLLARAVGPRLPAGLRRVPVPDGPAGAGAVLLSLALVAFLTGLLENLKPYRWDKAYVKTVGRDLASWPDKGAALVGNQPRVSHYAGLRHVPLPFDADAALALSLAREEGAFAVVIEESQLREWAPRLLDALAGGGDPPPGFVPAGQWSGGPGGRFRVRAFRLEAGP